MSEVSEQISEKKKVKKETNNPKKEKFKKQFENYTDIDINKEILYMQQLMYVSQKRSAQDINVIKWIILLGILASIIVGIIQF